MSIELYLIIFIIKKKKKTDNLKGSVTMFSIIVTFSLLLIVLVPRVLGTTTLVSNARLMGQRGPLQMSLYYN